MTIKINIEKNKIDLKYQRNLQYLNSSIIILATFIIAITLAILSEDIGIRSKYFHMTWMGGVGLCTLLITLIKMFRSNMGDCLRDLEALD